MRKKSKRLHWGFVALLPAACALPSADEFASGGLTLPEGGGGSAEIDGGAGNPSTEGGSVADGAAPTSFVCPPGAIFCDDFEGKPFDHLWKNRDDTGGTLRSGMGRIGQGLLAQTPQRGDGDDAHTANLTSGLGLEGRTPITISLDLNVSSLDDVGVLDLDFVHYHDPFLRIGVRIADYDERFFLHYYGDPVGGAPFAQDDIPITKITPGTWTRVSFSLLFGTGDSVRAKLTFDGTSVFDAPLPLGAYVKTEAFVFAGISGTDHAGKVATTLSDNVVVTSP